MRQCFVSSFNVYKILRPWKVSCSGLRQSLAVEYWDIECLQNLSILACTKLDMALFLLSATQTWGFGGVLTWMPHKDISIRWSRTHWHEHVYWMFQSSVQRMLILLYCAASRPNLYPLHLLSSGSAVCHPDPHFQDFSPIDESLWFGCHHWHAAYHPLPNTGMYRLSSPELQILHSHSQPLRASCQDRTRSQCVCVGRLQYINYNSYWLMILLLSFHTWIVAFRFISCIFSWQVLWITIF